MQRLRFFLTSGPAPEWLTEAARAHPACKGAARWKQRANLSYRVVFDISQNGNQLAILFLGPIGALLFSLVGWALRQTDDNDSRTRGTFFLVFSAAGGALSIFAILLSYAQFATLKHHLKTGRFKVAEGIVQDFVPMPPGGHATESFRVGDVNFRYGYGSSSTTFTSGWNQGYLHNGAQVRIAYDGGEILRVEVK